MREILFRGKNPVSSEWAYGSLVLEKNVFDERLILAIISDADGNETLVNPETVGQYTGLKDKNNVKAFEGDIVVCNQSGSYGISVIIYDNSAFYVMPLNGNILERTLWDYWYNDWDIEVIGNVHDGGAYD